MKKNSYLFVVAIFLNGMLNAQCGETNEERVLLVGDSWANFMNVDQTFNKVFDIWGHSRYTYYSNSTLAVNGAETNDFLLPAKKNEITTQLTNRPTIKIVHLSLGGNDVLGGWNTSYTAFRTDSLLDTVNTRLLTIVNFIKNVRPDIHVVISGYVYTNFEEVITTFASPSSHPFYNKWQGMGAPNNLALNTLLNRFSDTLKYKVANDPRITFIKATGLMQNIFGQITPLAVAPNGTYSVGAATLPKGFDNYPSPKTSMRNYGIFLDCFHLSTAGYNAFISYQTQKYYHKALMDNYYVLSEGGNRDGSITSTGVISNALTIGETAGINYHTALSFNTTSMSNTTIASANIFLRRKTLTSGTNPFVNNSIPVEVKIIHGKFGTTPDVEATDYTALAGATETLCIYGSYTNNNDWLRIDLSPTMIQQLYSGDITQFLITIPTASAGVVDYYDSSNPEFAPVLNVKYGLQAGISEITKSNYDSNFTLYPNPANDKIDITLNNVSETIENISIINSLGQSISFGQLNKTNHSQVLDISSLKNGLYFITVTTTSGKRSSSLVNKLD